MPKEKPYMLSLRLPQNTYDKIVIEATKKKRSINGQIIYALEQWMIKRKGKLWKE